MAPRRLLGLSELCALTDVAQHDGKAAPEWVCAEAACAMWKESGPEWGSMFKHILIISSINK